MKLSNDEIQQINSFFDNKSLSDCFIELFNLQQSLKQDLLFDNRGSIIGFRYADEHLRAYVGNKDGQFFVKYKTIDDFELFEVKNLQSMKEKLIENNNRFEKDIEAYCYKKEEPKTKKKKTIKRKASSRAVEKQNLVLAKLKNRNKAKKFTVKEFKALADWSYCPSFVDNGYVYTLQNGNRIECDSKSEVEFLDYLVSKKLALEIGAQKICIKYDTAFRKNCEYYPDVVVLTKDNHIALVEIKSVSAMSNHTNIEKYTALKTYCENNRYEYMMVDPQEHYITFDDLQKLTVPKEIRDRVKKYIESKKDTVILEKDDVNNLVNEFRDVYKRIDFELYLHAMVIQNKWYNVYKNGFKVFEKPQKIVLE